MANIVKMVYLYIRNIIFLIISKIKRIINKLYFYRNDYKMFLIIENKDLKGLKNLCNNMKEKNIYTGFYFDMKPWDDIFTKKELIKKNIKVYLCGLMDFCPMQHAYDIGWLEGTKYLIDKNIGCSQGCGLGVLNTENFLKYCDYRNINYK